MKIILPLLLVLMVGCSISDQSSGGATNPGNTVTTFQKPTALQIAAITGAGTASQLLMGNVNGDAYPDIVLLTATGAYIYLNQAGSTWSSSSQIAETAAADYPVGAARDLNFDSNSVLDFIFYQQSSALEIFRNDGATVTPTISRFSTLGRTDSIESVAYAAAGGSTKKGLIVAAANTGNHFWVQQLDSTLQAATNLSLASTSPESGVKALSGDVNGDGYVDFAIVPATSGRLVQFLQNISDNSVTVDATLSRDFSTSVRDSLLVDLNNDSKLDLLLAGSTGLELYTGNGAFSGFTVSSTVIPSAYAVAATSILATDFTGDGNKDLFMSRSGAVSVLYTQTGSLVFSDITSTAFGSLLSSGTLGVYSADVDQDGYPDVIELKTNGSIAVFINNLTN